MNAITTQFSTHCKVIAALSMVVCMNFGHAAQVKAAIVAAEKPRVIITCDPELDDNNSLIRFLLYSTDFDIRGLIYASSQFHWKGDGKGTTWWVPGREYDRIGKTTPMASYRYAKDEQFIDDNVAVYAQVYPNLVKHNAHYPSPALLKSKIREGNVAFDGDFSRDTPGSELIKQEIISPDTSTLFIQAWGGCSTIARALKSIEDIYGAQKHYEEWKNQLSKKIVLCISGDQDDTYARYIKPFWPHVRTLETGGMQVDLTFFGPLRANEEDKVFYSPEWTKKYVLSQGAFGKRYRVWGDGKQMVKDDIFDFFGLCYLGKEELQRRGYVLWMPLLPSGGFISEGDTFCYLNLIDNGLDAWKNQTWGGWAGAKVSMPKDMKDAEKPAYVKQQLGLPRFMAAVQNGFAARMKWSTTPRYQDCNHEPSIDGPAQISVKPGQHVSAKFKVSDPDGNAVQLQWHPFHVGNPAEKLRIERDNTPSPIFIVPANAQPGQTYHAVLEATDNGDPALTHYKRVILEVE